MIGSLTMARKGSRTSVQRVLNDGMMCSGTLLLMPLARAVVEFSNSLNLKCSVNCIFKRLLVYE